MYVPVYQWDYVYWNLKSLFALLLLGPRFLVVSDLLMFIHQLHVQM